MLGFQASFRINKSTFDIVADRVVPVLLAKRTENTGPIAVPPQKKLLVFLWYVSNTSSMREIANLFGLSKSTVHGVVLVHEVADVLCDLKDSVIKFPTAEMQRLTSQTFAAVSNIANIVGVIDGSHIRLSRIPQGDNGHINRKGFPSIVLQVMIQYHGLTKFTKLHVFQK